MTAPGDTQSADSRSRADRRLLIEVFLYLQVLDILTTLAGFSLGNGEASPFISMMIRLGPIPALVISKVIAVALAAGCLATNRRHLVRLINYWFAALVVWNLFTILKVLYS